jgi:hypothetical protein
VIPEHALPKQTAGPTDEDHSTVDSCARAQWERRRAQRQRRIRRSFLIEHVEQARDLSRDIRTGGSLLTSGVMDPNGSFLRLFLRTFVSGRTFLDLRTFVA